ncbi:unnamed protein product [Arabis nemorensis]|uniref:Uncharacterized protein n=1 Tax=Arabis nemorensis TaxID=586526 RepID=A0A565AJT8_9BRAS|nr:unnamed protein product [Arabis nemorensis]
MHTGDHNKRFIRESTKDACGATVVMAPIAKERLTKTFKKRTRKNDLILDYVGYAVCSLGPQTLLTVARQRNIGDYHASITNVQRNEAWKVHAAQYISNRIAQIQNHFQP